VGVSKYDGKAACPLDNPAHDAFDMGAALKSIGFDVEVLLEPTLQQLLTAVKGFEAKALPLSTAVFFFSGHGVQDDETSTNYLLPLDYPPNSIDLRRQALCVQELQQRLSRRRCRLSFLILDACRSGIALEGKDGKVKGRGGAGLGRMTALPGSVLAFSCAPGSAAGDGSGRNGVFTGQLLKHITTPGLDVDWMLRRVTRGVREETFDGQDPFHTHNLTEEHVCLVPGELLPAPVQPELPASVLVAASEGAFYPLATFLKACKLEKETSAISAQLSLLGVESEEDLEFLSRDRVELLSLLDVQRKKLMAGLEPFFRKSEPKPLLSVQDVIAASKELLQAIKNKNVAQARLFIEQGANLEYEDADKSSPLRLAIDSADTGMFKFVLSAGVKLDQAVLKPLLDLQLATPCHEGIRNKLIWTSFISSCQMLWHLLDYQCLPEKGWWNTANDTLARVLLFKADRLSQSYKEGYAQHRSYVERESGVWFTWSSFEQQCPSDLAIVLRVVIKQFSLSNSSAAAHFAAWICNLFSITNTAMTVTDTSELLDSQELAAYVSIPVCHPVAAKRSAKTLNFTHPFEHSILVTLTHATFLKQEGCGRKGCCSDFTGSKYEFMTTYVDGLESFENGAFMQSLKPWPAVLPTGMDKKGLVLLAFSIAVSSASFSDLEAYCKSLSVTN
jgi:hypothetical protein